MPPSQIRSTETRHVRDANAAHELFADLAGLPYELVGFAYLDPERRLLGVRYSPPGSRTAAAVSVRLVVADALAFDAVGVVMAHNHPGGDPAPSVADKAVTRRLARALSAVDVRMLDHIILTADRSTSFRALGLL